MNVINKIKCSFGFHGATIGHFQLVSYVNSALEDKQLRYRAWQGCEFCKKPPRTLKPVTPWDLLTKEEQDAKIALLQTPVNTAPDQ